MGRKNCRALVGLLSKRGHILEHVSDGTGDRRRLVEEVDESRSTVYRSLNELADAGLVEETAGDYELTLYGRLVYERYRLFDETVSDISAARDVLTTLSNVEEFDPRVVQDAAVIEPTRREPDRPLRALERTIETAASVKGIAPTTLLPNAVSDHSSEESTTELLIEANTLAHFEETEPEKLDRMRNDDRFVLHERQTELPFGLVVVEDETPTMMVVVYSQQWELKGLIRNDSDVAISWARETYRDWLPKGRPA